MANVIGVRFRNTGKTYFFDPVDLEITKDEHVIVDTAKGVEYGLVVAGNHNVDDERIFQPLRKVLRKATERDDQQMEENLRKEKEAFRICQEKIASHNLEMKLTEVEYAFDNSKILFYFTADGRVDFRELVKDLAAVFRTRIELRQIGVRDEARSLGGYGSCGRPLCCTTYLNDFVPVSIKMAKEQNPSLNPQKISGVCGRLMCCLKNEEETYEELNRNMPALGDIVATDDGMQGEVQNINVLRQLVKVLVEVGDDKELREYQAGQLKFIRRKKGKKGTQGSNIPMAELDENGELLKLQDDAAEPQERRREERGDKQERGDRGNRGDRQNRGGRNDRGERQERTEKQEQGDRQNREGRPEQGDRQNRRNNNRRRGHGGQNGGAEGAENANREQNAQGTQPGSGGQQGQGNGGNQGGEHGGRRPRHRHRDRKPTENGGGNKPADGNE